MLGYTVCPLNVTSHFFNIPFITCQITIFDSFCEQPSWRLHVLCYFELSVSDHTTSKDSKTRQSTASPIPKRLEVARSHLHFSPFDIACTRRAYFWCRRQFWILPSPTSERRRIGHFVFHQITVSCVLWVSVSHAHYMPLNFLIDKDHSFRN